jgi:hypothetical protein
MTRLPRLGVCALAAAWLGCDIAVDEDAPGADPPVDPPADPPTDRPVAPGPLVLSFHDCDGQDAPGGAFKAREQVFLRARVADEGGAFASGDFAFELLDVTGRMVSDDALDCRRFHVATDVGGIAEVRPGLGVEGAPCAHEWTVHADGTLLLQLVPFAAAPANGDGVAEYTIQVARVEDIAGGAFPAEAVRASFLIRAP